MSGLHDPSQVPRFGLLPRRPAAVLGPFSLLLVFAHVLALAYSSRHYLKPFCSHPTVSTSTLGWGSVSVTILIYVRNDADSLARTLTSLQPFRHAEIVCCDDASTDGSVSVILRHQRTNHRLLLRQNVRHVGLHVTRLRSLEFVHSPWLLFVNPGDQLFEAGVDRAVEKGDAGQLGMVQFECRNEAGQPCPGIPRWNRTWPDQMFRFVMHGTIARDIRGRVIRTNLYKAAMEQIPNDLRNMRTCAWGELLQFGYFLLTHRNGTSYVNELGETRGSRQRWKRGSNATVYDDCE